MDESFYNKLAIQYQNLSDRFSNFSKYFHDGYAIYDKQMFMVRDERLAFLKQFEELPFGIFFTKDHLQKYDNGGKYFSSNTVIEAENTVNIHTEFSMILFYYLINEMKDDISKFVEILESDAFKAKFNGFYKFDEYKLKYSLSQHELFFKFMMANVPNFGFIYHLFHRTNSGFMYVTDNDMAIRVKGIEDLLEANKTVYDFSKYKIV